MRINQHLLTDSGEVTSKRECWGFKWQYHTILFNERLRQRIVWLLLSALVVLIIIILVGGNQRFMCCGDGKLETYERLFEPSRWQQTGDLRNTFLTIVVTANWRPINNFMNHCVNSKREPLIVKILVWIPFSGVCRIVHGDCKVHAWWTSVGVHVLQQCMFMMYRCVRVL